MRKARRTSIVSCPAAARQQHHRRKGLARFDLDIAGLPARTGCSLGRFQFHMRRDPDGNDLDLMLQSRRRRWN